MQEFYFLFTIATIWIVFAVVQDLKTEEISNWLNYSLVATVLAYRAFYAVWSKDIMFFIFGLIGVLVFTVIAYAFYYGRVFGGGDVRLLIGLGGIFPYRSALDYLIFGGGFILLLFAVGAIWTLFYSLFLVSKNKGNFGKVFGKVFGKEFRERKWLLAFAIIFGAAIEIVNYLNGLITFGLFFVFFVLLPLFYIYAKTIEKVCMIKLLDASKLREGDWLKKDVRFKLGGKNMIINKSVHGLDKKEISLLRRARKKVVIVGGVPFTPAFFLALIVWIWIWLRYSAF